MAAALTVPMAAAALVLAAAGAAKMRSPRLATTALNTLGLPGSLQLVRLFGGLELAVAALWLLYPHRFAAAALAGVYVVFAGVTAGLIRRRADCGCFGQATAPASPLHLVLNLALAATALIAALTGAHGIGWVMHGPPVAATAVCLAAAGSAGGLVLAYTQLPSAWAAWSPR